MRPMEEIVSEVARQCETPLAVIRGKDAGASPPGIRAVRRNAILAVTSERPDLSSNQIARYFNRDSSTIRHIISTWGGAA